MDSGGLCKAPQGVSVAALAAASADSGTTWDIYEPPLFTKGQGAGRREAASALDSEC